uniref:Uncharacterized protein n=1 Tax=Vespula pensylvanica TaxID=30213 RepID=A0A834PBV2_VESPE|nr:hypothetical protein H0235_003356 [Vespula pensylvanica]
MKEMSSARTDQEFFITVVDSSRDDAFHNRIPLIILSSLFVDMAKWKVSMRIERAGLGWGKMGKGSAAND